MCKSVRWLVVAALLIVLAVPAAAGVRPPEGPIGFAIHVSDGRDVARALEGIVVVEAVGNGWWVGEAERHAITEVVAAGYAPVFLVPGTEGRLAVRDDEDSDNDGLTDEEEAIYHTDPLEPDSDQDFLSDGDEVHVWGTWPLRESHDGDRYDDGQEILGYSPFGLGQLGGDMPGYVLAPGDDVFVAAYPKIDFEVRDNIEMQATVETTIGSSTMTTETKTKTTTQRTLDMIEVGGGANVVSENQRGDNPDVVAEFKSEIDQTPATLINAPNGSPDLYIHEVTTGRGIPGEPTSEAVCGLDGDYSEDQLACFGRTTTDPLGVQTSQNGTVHSDDDEFRVPFDVAQCGLYRDVGSPKNLEQTLIDVMDETGILNTTSWWIDPGGRFSFERKVDPITITVISVVAGVIGIAQGVNNSVLWWRNRETDKFVNKLQRYSNGITVNRYEAHRCVDALNTIKKRQLYGLSATIWAAATGNSTCLENACIQAVMDYNRDLGFEFHTPFTGTLPKRRQYIREDLPVMIFQPASASDLVEWNRVAALIRDENYGKTADDSPPLLPNSQELTYSGGFDYGARLTFSHSDFGTGVEQQFTDSPTSVIRRVVLEDADGDDDDDGNDDDDPETDREIPVKQTHLEETIVTSTYSWSVTQEDWESTTTNSADFGTVTFSFWVRNEGTDMALDTAGLRFNLYIGDNPATPEVEDFNPITFPQIQDPAITFENVGPGDELLFGATVHLMMQQFRALDEGASLKIAVADYSYGSDELFYRSAAGGGVRFLIDNGVLEPDATRHEEFLVPVHQVWDEDLARLREPTYGEVLAQVVEVEHDDGVLRSINGRDITDSAWWSMMLTTPTDASLFYKSTALEGQTVRMEYHGDADADYYADAVELEHGTDSDDAEDHPAPVVIGALYEAPDPENPGWTLGRFKVTNTGDYEAYGMEARIYATDEDIEITDALVGGSGLVNPGETWDHPDDVFRYRSTGGAVPLLEIRYNDPEGLHILLSTVTLTTLDEDITGLEDLMVEKQRITANAIETFFYDVPGRVTVGYRNPTNRTVRDAWVVVDWQSLMGDILHHEARQLDLSPGDNYASFDFTPQDHLAPINIGGRFKALVRVMDHNGALIDSKVSYMTVWPHDGGINGELSASIALSTTSWEIGTVSIGSQRTLVLSIANVGGSPLDCVLSSSHRALKIAPGGSVRLDPGEIEEKELLFVSGLLSPGEWSGTVFVHSSDSSNSLIEIPVSAVLEEQQGIVNLFPVEGQPWDRRLVVSGQYPPSTQLVFDHDFQDDPQQVEPLFLYDGSWQTRLAYGEEVGPDGAGMCRLTGTERQMLVTLPELVADRAEYGLRFGKRLAHTLGFSEPLETSVVLPMTTLSSASLQAWASQRPIYDDFDGYTIDSAKWTTDTIGAGQTPGLADLQKVGFEIWNWGDHTSHLAKVTTTVDFRALETSSVFDYRVDEIYFWNSSSFSSATATVRIGTVVIESYTAYSGNPTVKTVPGYDGRLIFDRDQQVVTLWRDGEEIGSYDISGQSSWNITFEMDGYYNQQELVCWWYLDWTKIHRDSSDLDLAVGPGRELVWHVEGGVDPAETIDRAITSPDISQGLNSQLVLIGGESDVQMPMQIWPGYNGQTILTHFSLNEVQLASANLTPTNLTVTPSNPLQNGTATVWATVSNNGISPTGPFSCSLTARIGSQSSRYLGSSFDPVGLNPGEAAIVEFVWDVGALSGEVELTFTADAMSSLAETDETDNEVSETVMVLALADLYVPVGGVEVNPLPPVLRSMAEVSIEIGNSGQQDVSDATIAVFDGDPAASGFLVGRLPVAVSSDDTAFVSFPWVPTSAGPHWLFVRLDPDGLIDELDEDNNSFLFGPVPISSLMTEGVDIDVGDGLSDRLFDPTVGHGYVNGTALTTWGTLTWQSARHDLGGSVQYRFDFLDPGAMYHLNATFYEGDGVGRVMEIWVDGEDTGVEADLTDGLIHRVSATLDPAAYGDDGSILVEFRRQGPGDAIVNEIRLVQVEHTGIDCGDDGTTDVLYDPGLGHGYLNGSASTAWGAEPEHSVRYSTTGEVLYRFDGLDATTNYKVTATLYEGDGAGRLEELQVDGETPTDQVLLSDTPQDLVMRIPPAAYVGDGSVIVRVRCPGGPSAVVSELVLEEDTLPVRELSDGGVAPDAGDGSTVFAYSVVFTDLDGLLPDEVTVSIDGGAAEAMSAAEPLDFDTTDGKLYVWQTSGLLDGLHSYTFAALVNGGEPAAGDVQSHTGPLVGGPALPDAAEYGYIPAGDLTHDNQVIYAFGASSKTLRLGFELYDVDDDGEVELWLNGELLAAMEATDDGQWSGPRDLLLPAAMLRDDTANHLVFRNTLNQPSGTEPWGVRQVSLLAERPEGVTVTDVPADDGNALLVGWTPSVDDGAGLDNVVEYRVLRADSAIGPWTLVGTAAAGESLWVDAGLTCETTYWYQVEAWNGYQISAVNLRAEGAPLDNVAPLIAGASPLDGATDVPVGAAIVLQVSDSGQGVDHRALQARVDGAYVNPVLDGDPGHYTVTIVTRQPFEPEAEVTVTLEAADLASPPNEAEVFELSFTTAADAEPPYLFAASPADGATGVDPDTAIAVHLRDDGAGVDEMTVIFQVNDITVTPTISGDEDDLVLSYDPASSLTAGQVVEVSVSAVDLSAAANAMSDSWSFTVSTGEEGPVITAWSPDGNQVALDGDPLAFTVTAQDDTLDVMTVDWTVGGTPVQSGLTLNGSGGGDWTAVRELVLFGGASDYTDELFEIQLGAHSTTPGDYLIWDEFASLDPAWSIENAAPTAAGTLDVATSGSELSAEVDTYAFVYQGQTFADDWSIEAKVTADNTADSDGAGLLARVDADTWYFVGQVWDAGLAADAVALRFQTGGMSVVNLPAAEATATTWVRFVKKGNLLYAGYRTSTSNPWTELGAAPIIVDTVDVGLAVWDNADTLNASFDDLKLAGTSHPPITTQLTAAATGFADIRVTEDDGATERLIDFKLTDTDADEVADTLTFAADTTAPGVWKTYRVYYGNPSADALAVETVTGGNALSDVPTLGAETTVPPASLDWTATPPGVHDVTVDVSDGAYSDSMTWQVEVLVATPDAPAGLVAAAGDQSVYLSWALSDAENVAGYNVYRGGAGPLNGSPLTVAAFAETGLANGVEQCYTVRAVSPDAVESLDSAPACATPRDDTVPSPPPAVWAAGQDQAVRLTWYPSWAPDLAGYNVWRRVAGVGDLVQINTGLVGAASYLDSPLVNGTEYEYAVSTVDTSGNESALSAVVSATPDALAPDAPGTLTASQTEGTITLDWAASGSLDVAGYRVYRSYVSGMLYELQTPAPIAALTFDDDTGIEGLTYYYVVTAVGTNGAESTHSNEVEITLNIDPEAPENLDAEAGNREVHLEWDANTEDDLAGYSVYRSEAQGGPYSKITTVMLDDPAFADDDVVVDQTYYYVVTAVDELEAESPYSNEADAAAAAATVIVVNDEGDAAYLDGVADAVRASGRFIDQWDVRVLGSPQLADVVGYEAVIWNLGPEYTTTLSESEQAMLTEYLAGGGSLAVFGQDLIYDLGTDNAFLQTSLHVVGATQDSCGNALYGVLEDPVSDALELPLGPPFSNTCDVIAPDGAALTVFTNDLAEPVALRAFDPAGGKVFFGAFAFEGVSEGDPDPNNRATLMQRLLLWFDEAVAEIFSDGFEHGDTSAWSTATK